MAQGKESKEFVLLVAVLLNMESTSSRLKHSRQQSLKDVGFRGMRRSCMPRYKGKKHGVTDSKINGKGLTGFEVFCEDVLLAQTITGWSTVSLVVVKSDWGARKKLRHLVVMILATMKQEAMFTVSYTKGLSESKKKVHDGYKSEKWSLASTSVVVHIARCFLTSGGAMLSFQSYISGLLQCEKISEVLWMSFQEQQRFSLVLCSK
ncbi:hypothetical protein YC2023_017274 [Brassica napus]